MSRGGTFGSWSMKRVNEFLALNAKGMWVQPLPRGGYRLMDSERPKLDVTGKTPKQAAMNGGAYIPASALVAFR
jgi:hypothetical protein